MKAKAAPRKRELIPASEARDVLTDIMNRAGFANERFVMTRNGDEICAVVGMRDLERLEATDKSE